MYYRQFGRALTVAILFTVVTAGTALASDIVTLGEGGRPVSPDALVNLELSSKSSQGLTLSLDVPSVEINAVDQDGQIYHALTVNGENMGGTKGLPQLPVISRMVAVPAGKTLQINKIDGVSRELDGIYRPLPAQGLQSKDNLQFQIDQAYYAGQRGKDNPSLVTIGEPALMRDLRIVPLTFSPFSWDPATGKITANSEVTVSFDFVDAADANTAFVRDAFVPESFVSLYNEVLGFDKGADLETGLGTWIIVMPSGLNVLAAVDPLIDWRKRQGYNVIAVDMGTTGSSNSAIKSYLQTQYNSLEIPLEFVTLVGDANGSVALPTWPELQSGYAGAVGDHEYTRLNGGDIIADVHLGRLSVTSTSELATVVDKIVTYESSPHVSSDVNWFTRAGLTGDPASSGESCIWVSQWVKEQLLELNYTQIDTIFGGNYLTEMMSTIGSGESLFTYRGYWGMSGLESGYIGNLANGYKLPFAVILTCDTGTFENDTNCRSEAFLRAANGGGIAAIGTATIGTHTRYNNCVFQGVVDGVLNSGDPRFGPALTRGKAHLYSNYYKIEPDKVETWSFWNNLMGDPATAMWSAYPTVLDVDYPATISTGANAVPVTVMDHGNPVAGARVALYREGQVQVNGLTDEFGHVVLPVSGLTNGEILVTVTGQNLYPHKGGLNVGSVAATADFAEFALDDSSGGNGDGFASPGETVDLDLSLINNGTGGASGVTAVLTSATPLVTVSQATASYGYIGSGSTSWNDQAYVVTIDPAFTGGGNIELELVATTGATTWTSLVELTVLGPALTVASNSFGGVGGMMDPGEAGTIQTYLRNTGNLATSGFTAHLSTESQWVNISSADATYGPLAINALGNNSGNLFEFNVASDCYPGHLATFTIDVVFDEGGTSTLQFHATVGIADEDDPLGPDNYGYIAFDNTDTAYEHAPTYEWVEIDPSYGGSGTSVGLNDYSRWDDDTKTIDLPFEFNYYGQTFDTLSICSNGWVAMGQTYLRHYRNWSIPSVGTPDNMIAVFWDDLYQPGSDGGVFYYYDAANHRLIVEWSRMRIYSGSSSQRATFQVMLYDPAFTVGDTGDGVIVCQYDTVNFLDWETGYATAGIQNEDRDDGVLYTYWNTYPSSAAPLESGRAVAYRTVLPQIQGTLKGLISNDYNSAPIAEATVSVLGASRSLVTTDNGRFEGGIPVGTYDVAVHHPSFEPDTTFGVTIVEDAETVVNFVITDIAGPEFTLVTQPENTEDTVGPYAVTAEIRDYSGIADSHFYYTSSTTGGPFELTLQPLGGDLFGVDIPGQAAGSKIQYWFTGRDMLDMSSTEPVGAPFAPHAFVISNITIVEEADMETADGWVGGAAGDDATAGLWTRVDPNAIFEGSTEVQPEDDHTVSGTMCWVTGNAAAGSNQGVEDVDGGATTLLSPIYDISGMSSLQVEYYRWFTNDTGYSPGEDFWVVQVLDINNDWIDLENTNASNRSWVRMSFSLSDVATLGNSTQFRFIASDYGGGSVIEAAVDDFSLFSDMVAADLAAPEVSLTTYNNGGTAPAGDTVDILWSHSDDIGVVHVDILLSTDGGTTWPETLASGALLNSVAWDVPTSSSSTCRLKVVCYDASGKMTDVVSVSNFAIGGATPVSEMPVAHLALNQNAPNPFNPATEISFSLPANGDVRLQVYNIEGRLVRTLVNGQVVAGSHTVMWMGKDDRGAQMASGLYFYRLTTDDGTLTRKMTLLK